MPNPNRDPNTGRFISAKDAKEVNKALTATEKLLKDIGKDATISAEAFFDIAKKIADITKDEKDLAAIRKESNKTITNMSKVSSELAQANVSQLASKTETNKLLAKELIVKKSIASLDNKIAVLSERIQNASKSEAKAILATVEQLTAAKGKSQEVLDDFTKLKEANDELNAKTGWIDKIADVVGDVPVLGKLLKDFKVGADKAREAGVKGGSATKAGFASVLKVAGKAFLAFTGGTLLKGIFKANENITQISRNLNVSREAANRLNQSFNKAALSTKAFAGKDLLKATTELSESLGTTAILSTKSGVAIARLTKKLGLSAEEANKLTVAAAATGQNIEDINQKIVGTVMAQNIANKSSIRYQDVLKDVAGTSNATLMTTDKFAGGIAKAAFAARKMGLTLSEVAGISENLLDFESSISAEMEAEVMLGRNLELDRARMAAATGNQAVLAEELNRLQNEGVAFGDMNVFQQQAFAKALGMSRDQLADSLSKQAALNKLGIDSSKNVKAQLRDQIKQAIASGDQAKLDQISAELGEDELIRQEQNKSFAEGQTLAMNRLVEVAGQFGDILNPITKMMEAFSSHAGSTLGFIGKMGAKLKNVFKAVKPVLQTFKAMGQGIMKGVRGIGKFFGIIKGGMKVAGKGGIKMVLKKIPVLGALVGAGLAYKRFKDGDYLGAGAELLSGIASIFPGIGTAASIAIDSALLAGDMKGVTGADSDAAKKRQADPTSQAYKEDDIFLNDFTIRANPKDTITMAGGTKLGGNVEALLAELIGEVKKGGNVFLDGTSVGDALVLNSRLTN